jgi:hypothetical protein
MANYCSNTLMLNEDSDDSILDILKEYLDQKGNLSFRKIRPIPTAFKRADKNDKNLCQKLTRKYGASNWWDWCVMNWGTKSESEVYYAEPNGIGFTTAWSPPIGIVRTLSLLTNREFRLTYIEEGEDFCGEYFSYPNWLLNHDYEFSPIKNAPKKLQKELCYKNQCE